VDQQGRYSATVPHNDEGAWRVADVLGDIGSHIREIVRAEIASALKGFSETAKRARPAAMLLAVGALLAAFALGFFLLTVMFALAILLPLWLAALAIAVVSLAVGYSALSRGRRRLQALRLPAIQSRQ
jgi:hypothetical protein